MANGIRDALSGKLVNPPSSLIEQRYGIDVIAKSYLDVLLPSTAPIADSFPAERTSVG